MGPERSELWRQTVPGGTFGRSRAWKLYWRWKGRIVGNNVILPILYRGKAYFFTLKGRRVGVGL